MIKNHRVLGRVRARLALAAAASMTVYSIFGGQALGAIKGARVIGIA